MAIRRHAVLAFPFVALIGCSLSAPPGNAGHGRDASSGADLGALDNTLVRDDVPTPSDVPMVPEVQSGPDAPSAEDRPPADASTDAVRALDITLDRAPLVDDAYGVDAVPDSVVVLDGSGVDSEGDEGDDAPVTEAGTPLRVGSCADRVDWTQAIVDRSTTGTGACAASTVDDFLGVIQTEHPELADIFRPVRIDAGWLCTPDGTSCSCLIEQLCVSPTDVKVVRYGDGFRIALQRLSGVSGIGSYHNYEYWYFETNGSCHPDLVGYFFAQPTVGLSCTGSPLWGFVVMEGTELDCVNGRMTPSSCHLDGGAVDAGPP